MMNGLSYQVYRKIPIIAICMILGCKGRKYMQDIPSFDDSKQNVKSIFISDSNTVMIGGINRKTLDDTNTGSSFFIKKNKGSEWKSFQLGEGELISVKSNKNIFFATKRVKHKGILTDTTIFIVSKDDGKTWQTSAKIPHYVKDFLVSDTNINTIYFLCRRTETGLPAWSVLLSKDGGNSWDEILQEDSGSVFPFISGNIFYLAAYANGTTNIQMYVDGNVKNYALKFNEPSSFFINGIALKNSSEFYLIGHYDNKDNDSIVLYKYDIMSNSLSIVSKLNSPQYLPISLHVFNNTIALLMSKISGITTKEKIIYSLDSGTSWKDIFIDNVLFFEPYQFLNNSCYGYVGIGKVKVYDFK